MDNEYNVDFMFFAAPSCVLLFFSSGWRLPTFSVFSEFQNKTSPISSAVAILLLFSQK